LQLWPADTEYEIWASFIVEVTPLEDCVPDGPVEVRIERVLSGEMANTIAPPKAGEIVLLCDHHNDDPQPMYAGKTYLLCPSLGTLHNPQSVVGQQEYWPNTVTFSTQYRPDGSPAGEKITPPTITEVTDGFYETDIGRLWIKYIDAQYNIYKTVPVLPTGGTKLLLPFYNETASIVAGEDITPAQYADGERVCLISEGFARENGLSPGDTLRLPLYYADYANAPLENFGDSDLTNGGGLFIWNDIAPLDAGGEPYKVFSDHEYVIRGVYYNSPGNDPAFAMGCNTVIVPAASVRESDADNILAFGPMRDETTAFQIRNGGIEEFTEKWLARGVGDLEITFHDRGYTALRRGLENMKRVSALFLAIGAAMSLALVFFFCNVFISKNRLRTAVERMLGYTKRQCAASLLSGFLLAAAIAVAIGCGAGAYAEGEITKSVSSKEYYDTSYTIGPLGESGAQLEDTGVSPLYAPAAGLLLLLVTCAVSGAFMRGNVSREPLAVLGGKAE
jgi:hypothetical protein